MKRIAVRTLLSVAAAASMLPATFAVEAQPSGQFQVQSSYYKPELIDGSQWALEMPETYVGVTAAEQLANSAISGYIEVGVDAFREDSSAAELNQAYMTWTQSTLSLSAGQLKTLEQAYVLDYATYIKNLPRGGLQAAEYVESAESEAVRLTAQSGEYLSFSGQLALDSASSETDWGVATVVTTPDGTFSVTYRHIPGESALWGNQVTWVSGTVSLSGAYLYQDEMLGYDLDLRMTSNGVEGFFGYSRSKEDNKRWQLGVNQPLSDSVTSFSEIMWWPDDSAWKWSTGFQLTY